MANLKLVVNERINPVPESGGLNHGNVKVVRDLVPKRQSATNKVHEGKYSALTVTMVIIAHVIVFAILIKGRQTPVQLNQIQVPMMVTLVSNPVAEEKAEQPLASEAKAVPVKKQVRIKESLPASQQAQKQLRIEEQVNAEPSEKVEPAQYARESMLNSAIVMEQKTEAATAEAEQAKEQIVEPPRFGAAYLNNPVPAYPASSRRMGEQGRVLLKVLVAENGRADTVQVEKSSGHEKLDQAAIEAVMKWSFIPAKRSNQPVAAYVLVPVKFSLNS